LFQAKRSRINTTPFLILCLAGSTLLALAKQMITTYYHP
jgi:hypothetical protein